MNSLSTEAELHNILRGLGRISHVFVVPWFVIGGAEREISQLCEAILVHHPGKKIVVLLTDRGDCKAKSWLPSDVLVIDASDTLSEFDSHRERGESLFRVMKDLTIDAIICAGSFSGWNLLKFRNGYFPNAPALFVGVAMPVFDDAGRRVDPESIFLADIMPALSGVLMDSAWYARELVLTGLVRESDRSKLHPIAYPVQYHFQECRQILPAGRKMRVLWASRLAEVKRPAKVVDVAYLCPFAEFSIWGEGDTTLLERVGGLPDNITYMGGFTHFGDVDPGSYDCFLYTSVSDGTPNVILEAIASGLPVIAPAIGGITEIISDDTGYLLDVDAASEDFAATLLLILGNYSQAIAKANRAQDTLRMTRAVETFYAQLRCIPRFLLTAPR